MKTGLAALMLMCMTLPAVSAEPHGEHSRMAVWRADTDDGGGWLGVSIQDMTPRLARSLDVETTMGALVSNVIEESPAEAAGINDEDIIVEFDGRKIVDSEDLMDRVCEKKPGDEVGLVLMRGSERKSLTVTLGKQKNRHAFAFTPPPMVSPHVQVYMSHSSLGMEVEEIGDQLSEYFGAPGNEGVLVTEVDEEGPAHKAGLKAGDILLKVGSQTIHEPDDIWDEVEEHKKGEMVSLEVLRDKTRTTLSMEIGEAAGRSWFRGPESDMRFDFDFDGHFDHESLRDLEREMERGHRRGEPELDELKEHLREIGRTIREWGDYLKEQIESIHWVNS